MGPPPQERMPLPAIRAVSFDLDGTLYATGPHRRRLLPRLLPQIRLIQAWQVSIRGLRAERPADLQAEILQRSAQSLALDPERVEERLWFFLERTWAAALRPGHVLPGVARALGLLDSRGVPRAIASDHPPQLKLRNLGLGEGWQAQLAGETLNAFKPHPEVLLEAARIMGCPPVSLLHVGDRADTDGEAARRAGARFLDVCDSRGSTTTLATRIAALLDEG